MVKFTKINEVYTRIDCEQYLINELSDHFARFADNYRHMKLFKKGLWDGKIRYLNRGTRLFYTGLLKDFWAYCKNAGESDFEFVGFNKQSAFTEEQILDAIERYNLPVVPYQHQIDGAVEGLTKMRRLLLSATSSGKSLIIYIMIRMCIEEGLKVFIKVPSVLLVNQLYSDFAEYAVNDPSFNIEENVYKVSAGKEKYSEHPVLLSTWQSINVIKRSDDTGENLLDYMSQFDVVITDEVHEDDAEVSKTIMENAVNARYRIGLTGTIDIVKTQIETLVGLYGKSIRIKTTKELIDDGMASPLKIYAMILKYNDEDRKLISKADYHQELDYIISREDRNMMIAKLAGKLTGNTVILVRHINKHAKKLKELIEANTNKRVILITKDTKEEIREDIRKELETIDDAVIIATYKLMSTGVSIKNLMNLIYGSPLKSFIPIIQSIGRILRLHKNKKYAKLFDFVDDLEYNGKSNHTLEHFRNRFGYYIEEGHDVEVKEFKL